MGEIIQFSKNKISEEEEQKLQELDRIEKEIDKIAATMNEKLDKIHTRIKERQQENKQKKED